MKKLNSSGFSAVEALLVIIILGMIGFIGYFVWHSKQATDKTLSMTNKSTAAKSSTSKQPVSRASKSSPLAFKELGVSFTVPSTLQGMTYEDKKLPDTNGGQVDVAYLKEPQLTSLGKQCATANGASADSSDLTFAAVGRQSGTYDASKAGDNSLLKQFDGFYITISYPNGGGCNGKNDDLNTQVRTRSAADGTNFVAAFKASGVATP